VAMLWVPFLAQSLSSRCWACWHGGFTRSITASSAKVSELSARMLRRANTHTHTAERELKYRSTRLASNFLIDASLLNTLIIESRYRLLGAVFHSIGEIREKALRLCTSSPIALFPWSGLGRPVTGSIECDESDNVATAP
jgi:hypothetical protein